ncbi:UPF0488 protein C8orf33 homolog [Galendromus occidentalis]|uniref:UPF0488 protein C8orf33 homolog n=1 Tax=Galendromus occidentalis TaxID=34638 RepID=A0AAJ6QRB2_9ACAR|nr:UPF0488 protein C8orf33 homolog [Galendromus occidentalis]
MDDEQEQFQKELSWCISALRKVFQKSDPTRNQIKEALKALQILENPKAPVVKKRLAMRNALGDYRAKMAAEEKHLEKQLLQGKRKLAEFTSEKADTAGGKVLAKAASPSSSTDVYTVGRRKPPGLSLEVARTDFRAESGRRGPSLLFGIPDIRRIM